MKCSMISCKVCGEPNRTIPINSFRSIDAVNHFAVFTGAEKSNEFEEHIRKLWASDECEIYLCQECESRFAIPHVAGDAKFYGFLPPATYPDQRWEFKLTSGAVLDLLKGGGNLLEIGGGQGHFVNKLINLGLKADQITVTEFSESAAKSLKLLGVNVAQVGFRSGLKGKKFQVIILFQTLEHLDNLSDVINKLSELGLHGANLFISVPNVTNIIWSEKNLGIPDMPPNHITSFSAEGLRKLFLKSNWQIVDLQLQDTYSLSARWKQSAMRTLIFPSGLTQKFLSKILVPETSRYRKISLVICAGLAIIVNPSWVRKVPPENIWIHLKKL